MQRQQDRDDTIHHEVTVNMKPLSAALLLVALLSSRANGFHASSAVHHPALLRPLQMSSPSNADTASSVVPIIIDGRNIEVTPALEEYVNKRIGGTLNKLSSNGAIRECDVILSVSKNPKVSEDPRREPMPRFTHGR
jgi:Sigma 54 modulation protein / S30EA ribosomal protein